MKKSFLLLILGVLACMLPARAQVVTTGRTPLQEDSEGVVVFFHADEGNQGLMNMPPETHIYAHTGVQVEDADGTVTDWKYAPSWEEDLPKYQLEYVSPNLWKLNIGDIRTYYGVAATGPLSFSKSILADVVSADTKPITFTATTTEEADIKILVGDNVIGEGSGVKTLRATYKFETIGNFEVKAVATKNGKTLTKTIGVVYARDSQPAADQTVPPMGLTKNADGSYTFCLAAPGKEKLMLIGSWNGYRPDNAN